MFYSMTVLASSIFVLFSCDPGRISTTSGMWVGGGIFVGFPVCHSNVYLFMGIMTKNTLKKKQQQKEAPPSFPNSTSQSVTFAVWAQSTEPAWSWRSCSPPYWKWNRSHFEGNVEICPGGGKRTMLSQKEHTWCLNLLLGSPNILIRYSIKHVHVNIR